MRLSDIERNTIKNSLKGIDPDALVYLFGSRVDDEKKGGDIDLLVFSEKMGLRKKIAFQAKLWQRLGEQKIDVVIPNKENLSFVKFIKEQAVPL